MKDGAHPLKLIRDMATLLLVGIGEYNEMRAANLYPIFRRTGQAAQAKQ
jgi:hypothetical protein